MPSLFRAGPGSGRASAREGGYHMAGAIVFLCKGRQEKYGPVGPCGTVKDAEEVPLGSVDKERVHYAAPDPGLPGQLAVHESTQAPEGLEGLGTDFVVLGDHFDRYVDRRESRLKKFVAHQSLIFRVFFRVVVVSGRKQPTQICIIGCCCQRVAQLLDELGQ